jgi:hypothetical protein
MMVHKSDTSGIVPVELRDGFTEAEAFGIRARNLVNGA